MLDINGTTDGIPNSILANFAIGIPPNGTESNFVDGPNTGWSLIIVGAVLTPIMLVFMAIRMDAKLRIMRKTTADDITCLIAAFLTLIYYTIHCVSIVKGGYGRHQWDISALQSIDPWFAVPIYINNWFGTVVIPFVKCTFFIFYIHLFRPIRWLRMCCYAGIVVTVVAFTGFWIAQMVLQTPRRGQSWLAMNLDPRNLYSLKHLSIPITATSFGIDIFTFLIPMMGVAKLKLTFRRKLGVILVFITGFAAVVASFLGVYYKVRLNDHTNDSTWESVPVSIAILVEMEIGIICACMPSLANFLGHQFPNFSIVDSVMSLKIVSFMTTGNSRTGTRSGRSGINTTGPSETVSSRKHPYKVAISESDENLNTPEHKIPDHDVEMGHVTPQSRTRVASGAGLETDPLRGIHMQQEWAVYEENR